VPEGGAPVFVDGRDGWPLDGRHAWTSSDSGRGCTGSLCHLVR